MGRETECCVLCSALTPARPTPQPYVKDKNFRPEVVKSLSKALVGLCQWVIALEKFYRVNRIVKPKKEMLVVAEREFNEV